MAGLNPDISFTPTVEAEFGKENVTVVKDALGGQPIRRWYKKWKPAEGYDPEQTGYPLYKGGRGPGDLYDRLMEKVNEATAGNEYATVSLVWMQGEKDAKESHGEVYAASMKGLIKQLSDDLGRGDINFVLGRLSDFDMANEKYPHWTVVREALVEVAEADPRGAWINTDDLNDGLNKKGRNIKNDLHMSVEGYKTMGKRFADKAIELIEAGGASVEAHPVVRLWTIEQIGGEQNRLKEEPEIRGEGKTTYRNIKDPNLTVSQVESSKPTPAVVYCPGGAYKQVSVLQDYIDWLNGMGITVFTLKYTVPNDRDAAFRDVQRAMRLVRYQAEKWNVDPDQLGVVGSSAGGHLVLRLSQNYTSAAYPAFDDADKLDCQPAFVVTASAAYLFKSKSDPTLVDEFPMKGKIAPTFMVCAMDDKSHGAGSVVYEKALRAAGGTTKIIISETGGHGLKEVEWHPECRAWLKGLGVGITGDKQ